MTALSFGRGIACGLALLAWITPARANIGDSMQDLRDRYGSMQYMQGEALFVIKLKDGQIVAAKDPTDADIHFSVTVYFDHERSAMEIFTRNSSDPAKANMTDDEVKTIITALGDGQQWTPVSATNGKQIWLRADKKVIAKFDPSRGESPDDASVLVVQVNQ